MLAARPKDASVGNGIPKEGEDIHMAGKTFVDGVPDSSTGVVGANVCGELWEVMKINTKDNR